MRTRRPRIIDTVTKNDSQSGIRKRTAVKGRKGEWGGGRIDHGLMRIRGHGTLAV